MITSNLVRIQKTVTCGLALLAVCSFSLAAPAHHHQNDHAANQEGSAAPKVVIGKLGQVRTSSGIHVSMNDESATYWIAQPQQYLVLSHTKSKKWWGVLLQNGAIGYIPTYAVDALPFLVTRTAGMKFASRVPTVIPSGVSDGTNLAERTQVASYALNFIGTPYVWGGNSLRHGVDCSGFVKRLYGTIGFDLPRTAAEQALVGKPITRLEDLEPGDRLYFWEASHNKIGHTGLYIGNGYFVHSSVNHHGVATDYLTPAWRKILVAARR